MRNANDISSVFFQINVCNLKENHTTVMLIDSDSFRLLNLAKRLTILSAELFFCLAYNHLGDSGNTLTQAIITLLTDY